MNKTLSSLLFCLCLFSCQEEEPKTPEVPTGDVITVTSDWFEVSSLNDQTYVIEEPKSSQGNVSYLFLGDSKALMLDTGTGENSPKDGSKIKHILTQITTLPIDLLLSHFHFDHNQNIAEFDRVVFPDLPFLRQAVSTDEVYTFTGEDLFWGSYPGEVQVAEWLPLNTDIDLGNRSIQLVNLPGHTDESVIIVDQKNKLAFMGDYLYNGALFIFHVGDLPAYEESVDYLLANLTADYRLFGAHGSPEIAFTKLQTLKDFLLCIGNQVCESTASTVLGEPVLLYNYEGMEIVLFE